jgi:hypothetical protein
MANTDNANGFHLVKSLCGHAEYVQGKVPNSTKITAGDPVIEDATSAGYVDVATTSTGLLLGISAESVSTTASTTDSILFYPAIPSNVFEVQCMESGFAQTDVYSDADIHGTTGSFELNAKNGTEGVCQIVGVASNNSEMTGDYTRVHVIILRSSYVPLLAAK